MNWPCFFASCTHWAYFFVMRSSAPHAVIIRIPPNVSLATELAFASAWQLG